MAVKKLNPVTPGSRYRVGQTFTELTTDTPEKSLLAPLKKSGGRNSSGHLTMRQRGGGHKHRYRVIDFKRDKDGVNAIVKTMSTTPTARRSSPWWSIPMAKNATSLHPTA